MGNQAVNRPGGPARSVHAAAGDRRPGWLIALVGLAVAASAWQLAREAPGTGAGFGPDAAGGPPTLTATEAADRQRHAARSLGVETVLTLDLGDGATMELALVPAGRFLMGSPEGEPGRQANEGPRRPVTISRPFYLGVCEVTQRQWKAVMGTEPWSGRPDTAAGDELPAVCISWDAAVEFCRELTARTGRAVRLPSEAEWEYACRAGTGTRFGHGDDEDLSLLGRFAWFEGNAANVGLRHAQPVGRKRPNAWGLHDMHGNVMEWCADRYGPYTGGEQVDPVGPPTGSLHRVIRGGSFDVGGEVCRSACRGYIIAFNDWPMFGLRVAADAEP